MSIKGYPILQDSQDFSLTGNGLGLLTDVISCTTTEELNGSLELALQYDVQGKLVDEINNEMLIRAYTSPELGEQLFRIYNTKKSIDGNKLNVKARHVTNDLGKVFIPHAEIEAQSQNGAMQLLISAGDHKSNITLYSDRSTVSSTTLDRVTLLQAVAGTNGSLLDNWGGEVIRDNLQLRMVDRRGADNGYKILYRKNLAGLDVEVDTQSIVVAIYPFATKESVEITLPNNGLVKSDLYDKFPDGIVLPVDYSQDESVVDVPTLQAASKGYFKTHDNAPSFSASIDFAPIKDDPDFAKFANLETVGMGDTVRCYYSPFGVDLTGRVVKYTFDVLNQEYQKLEVGSIKADFIDRMVSSLSDLANNTPTTNAMQQAINKATDLITGNDGGYVYFYPKNRPSDVFFMDTEDPNTAKKVLRLNKSGIGFSKTGVNGPFTTAWTLDGAFNASFITTGQLNANLIKVGFNTIASALSIDSTGMLIKGASGASAKMTGQGLVFYNQGGKSVGSVTWDYALDANGNATVVSGIKITGDSLVVDAGNIDMRSNYNISLTNKSTKNGIVIGNSGTFHIGPFNEATNVG